MEIPSVEQLADAGLHFGHKEGAWHPSMKPYIYTSKQGVHIFDLEKTREKLEEALEFIRTSASKDKDVLLVGTKVRIGEVVEEVGDKAGLYYIGLSWLGGLLTNFQTIRKNIEKLNKMEEKREKGEYEHYTKKEQLEIDEEIEELNKIYGGVKNMTDPPDIMVVLDGKTNDLAVREANKLDIPTVLLADSNVDITEVEYPIPGNDDAIKAVELITKLIGKAYQEGREEAEKSSKKKKGKGEKEEDKKKQK